MLVEGHMDDGITFSRAQEEESRSARVIRKCQSLFNRFNKYVIHSCLHFGLPLVMIRKIRKNLLARAFGLSF